MRNVFITQTHVYQDRSQRSLRVPSDRFAKLLEDVFAKHGTEFDRESVMQGSQFSYLDLLTNALSTRPIPPETDVIVFASCASEFDPKQPGMGASFQARFGAYDLHAICNEGILGGFTALHLATKFVGHQNRKVCLLAVEQNTNPLPKNYTGFVPTENVVGMLDLQADANSDSPRVIASGVVHKKALRKKIDDLAILYGLSRENLNLHVGHEKQLVTFVSEDLKECDLHFHDYPASIAQFAQCMTKLSAVSNNKLFSLLLLEDVFSNNCGFLLLKESGL